MTHYHILWEIPCVLINDIREELWPPILVTIQRTALVCMWNATVFKEKISVITSPPLLTYFTIKIILAKQDYWF